MIDDLQAQADQRAAAGAALLDSKLDGWREKIDLDELNVMSTYDCVLGQLFPSYVAGVTFLFGTHEEHGLEEIDRMEQAHGFEVDGFGDGLNYDRLTTAWLELLS